MHLFQGLIPFKLHWSHPRSPFLVDSPPPISDLFSGILWNLRMAWRYEPTIEKGDANCFTSMVRLSLPHASGCMCYQTPPPPLKDGTLQEVSFTPCVMTFCNG